MPAATTPTAPPSRWLALGVITTGTLMNILDGSIVTVALPTIQDDLGFSPASLSWVVNAYLIAFGSLLLLSGRLGDLIGRKRVFLAGTGVFTLASLLAGAATSPFALIAARFLQGAGGALASAVSLGILVTLFTEPAQRAKAIAIFSFTGAAGASIGQVLGGVLTEYLSWNWIFLINLPIGLAALAIAVPVLPTDRGLGLAAGADILGALLVTAGLMLGVTTAVRAEEHGWASGPTLGLGALAAVLLAGFALRQAKARTPLMPPRILRSRAVVGANLIQILMVAALFSFQVFIALYMQRVLDYGAATTGLAMLPSAIIIGAMSLGVSARLIGRFGERVVLLTGLALLVGLLCLLARLPVHADYLTDLLPVMLLAGGFGLALPALTALAMSGATDDDAGLASGLFNTTQQVGMAMGVAVLSTLAASRTDEMLAAGANQAEALTGGYHLAFGIGAALLATALTIALTVLRRPTPTPGPSPRERESATQTTASETTER
ncbi:EmrB/QacA subfamily drug resistance transporter [Lipingzhangella halophila]|uniref:EmrB/QacA subfamily drug resistance transporter n=1 Tax=Lipingzhangella halophila TaxID=1783352 RepID=A0A7W7W2H6_9ACTN|nr:MFS transporter [Lipingzhangella halophila]MBB4931992.1 EmrB/QacA subfamily drug resistance transporter [Lipingzhangella halophila]